MSSEERGDSTGTIAAVCGVGVCGGVCMCVVWGGLHGYTNVHAVKFSSQGIKEVAKNGINTCVIYQRTSLL